MTVDKWIESIPDDEREALCVADGWKAGATAMLEALIDRGFISDKYYSELARRETKDIIGDD